MKQIHTGVTVWCILNIGFGIILLIIAAAFNAEGLVKGISTIDWILSILTIILYCFALSASPTSMIGIIIVSIISNIKSLSNSGNNTMVTVISILSVFIDWFIFFKLEYNGKTAFQVGKEKNSNNTNTENIINDYKICPFCANKIKKEAIVCQYCNRDLPKEDIKQYSENSTIIDNNSTNHTNNTKYKWKCRDCGNECEVYEIKCLKCGGELIENK